MNVARIQCCYIVTKAWLYYLYQDTGKATVNVARIQCGYIVTKAWLYYLYQDTGKATMLLGYSVAIL